MVDKKYFEEEIKELPEEEKIEILQEVEEEVIEIKKEKKTPKVKSEPKEKYTVLNITPKKLILKDEKGNGIERPLPKKIDFKIGDKIEL